MKILYLFLLIIISTIPIYAQITQEPMLVSMYSDFNENQYMKATRTYGRVTDVPYWVIGPIMHLDMKLKDDREEASEFLGGPIGIGFNFHHLTLWNVLTTSGDYQYRIEILDNNTPYQLGIHRASLSLNGWKAFQFSGVYIGSVEENLWNLKFNVLDLSSLVGNRGQLGFNIGKNRYSIFELGLLRSFLSFNIGDEYLQNASLTYFTGIPLFPLISIDRFDEDDLLFVQPMTTLWIGVFPISYSPQFEYNSKKMVKYEIALDLMPCIVYYSNRNNPAMNIPHNIPKFRNYYRRINNRKNRVGESKFFGISGLVLEHDIYDPYTSLDFKINKTSIGIEQSIIILNNHTAEDLKERNLPYMNPKDFKRAALANLRWGVSYDKYLENNSLVSPWCLYALIDFRLGKTF